MGSRNLLREWWHHGGANCGDVRVLIAMMVSFVRLVAMVMEVMAMIESGKPWCYNVGIHSRGGRLTWLLDPSSEKLLPPALLPHERAAVGAALFLSLTFHVDDGQPASWLLRLPSPSSF